MAHANLLCTVRGWTPIAVIQSEYNMLERHVEREVLPYCRAHDVGLVPYFPLAGAFDRKVSAGRAAAPRLTRRGQRRLKKYMVDAYFDRVERLAGWAASRERGLNELAQAWLMAQPAICSVISGATGLEQLLSNVKAADWNLTADELREVNALLV